MSEPRRANFRQADLARAMKAAASAGAHVLRVEIEGGKITLVIGNETDGQPDSLKALQEWRRASGSRHA